MASPALFEVDCSRQYYSIIVIHKVQEIRVRIRCTKENLPSDGLIMFNIPWENDGILKAFLNIIFFIE